jgi:CheY-like chemotaxis protein
VLPRPFTVLLVEDDEATRLYFAEVLTRHGYLVVSAPTGRDAVAACWDMTEPIDMVLLDVHLPDVSGVDLCARLRDLNPDLPVVVCSGEAEPQEVARLLGPVTQAEYTQVMLRQVACHEPLSEEARDYYLAKGRVLAGLLRPGMTAGR